MRLRFLPALALAGLALLLLLPAVALAGAFVPGSSATHTVGTGPRAIATGDFNEDGRPDMAVGNEGASGVSVLLGLAGGGFAPAVLYNTGPVPGEIAVADFDRDGHLDFAVGHYNTNTVVIMRGTGTGTFTSGVTLTGPPHPEGMCAVDLNADGAVDLATCGYPTTTTGTASVWLNTGAAGGALSFGARADYAVGAWPNSIRAGEFANGRIGLVTANYNGASITILDNDGAGHFTTRTDLPAPPHVYMADAGSIFNGSSRSDIVTANADSNSISLYRWVSAATGWVRTDHATGSRPCYVRITDADADGTPDVVTSNYVSGQYSVFPADPWQTSFHTRLDVPTLTNPYAVAIADFDSDGKPDLVASSRSGNTVRVTRGLSKRGWGLNDTIPDFTAQNQYGTPTRLGPGSGKWQLVDLCSSWCVPCKVMAQHTQQVYEAWHDHPMVRFDYITLLSDGPVKGTASTQADAAAWAATYFLNRPVLHAAGQSNGGTRAMAIASDAWGTPTLRLVGPDGVVRWLSTGQAAETTLVRVIANCAGVAIPALSPINLLLVPDTLRAATETLAYGSQTSSSGLLSSPGSQWFQHSQPAGTVGNGIQSYVDIRRSPTLGRESWSLSIDATITSLVNVPTLPSAQPWKLTLTGLSLDPAVRVLAPGMTGTLTVGTRDFVSHSSPASIPVSWDGSALVIGDITPAMLASWSNNLLSLSVSFEMLSASSTADVAPAATTAFVLGAPSPNPAAREARLSWAQPRAGDARLEVFDLSGRLVRTLDRGAHAAGEHKATWDLADEHGAPVNAGLYFARIAVAGEGVRTARLTVVR